MRGLSGAAAVARDALLDETAQDWADILAASGVISHRGKDGSRALDRYQSRGGTEARIGEILGAGGSLREIELAWERSESHRSLAVQRDWTHAGWGRGSTGAKDVWVVLFCQKLVDELSIEEHGDSMVIGGRYVPREAEEAVLLSGIERLAPALWDRRSRRFLFRLPLPHEYGYFRLGFSSTAGEFCLTNAFTWPRGRGSRGAAARFSAPEASP
jgi:hypothetical protein